MPDFLILPESDAHPLSTHSNAFLLANLTLKRGTCDFVVNVSNRVEEKNDRNMLNRNVTGMFIRFLSHFAGGVVFCGFLVSSALGSGNQLLQVAGFADGLGLWALNQGDSSLAGLSLESSSDGKEVACVEIFEGVEQPYAVELRHMDLAFDESRPYRLRFRARASEAREIKVRFQGIDQPYRTTWEEKVSLGQEWQDFEIEALSKESLERARLAFLLGAQPGKVWFADITLTAPE